MPSNDDLWSFLPWGYFATVAIELPILFLFLSARHSPLAKVFAGFWLTACTYPIVALVLPLVVWARYGRPAYLGVAETFAPLAECLLFYLMFPPLPESPKRDIRRDLLVIVLANVASFLIGVVLFSWGPLATWAR